MRNNTASKKEAVRLIKHAVRSGWTRSVDTLRSQSGRPYAVIVQLRNSNDNAHTWGQVFVNFRRPHDRWSVECRSQCEYAHELRPGYSEARYQISRCYPQLQS